MTELKEMIKYQPAAGWKHQHHLLELRTQVQLKASQQSDNKRQVGGIEKGASVCGEGIHYHHKVTDCTYPVHGVLQVDWWTVRHRAVWSSVTAHTHTHTHTRTHARTHTRTYTHMHTCMHKCTYMYTNACVPKYTHTHTNTHTHTHTHTCMHVSD